MHSAPGPAVAVRGRGPRSHRSDGGPGIATGALSPGAGCPRAARAAAAPADAGC